MKHIQYHMTSFGILRCSDTDQNESQHKTIKMDYINTNRSPQCLAVQMLKNGYADYLDTDRDVHGNTHSNDTTIDPVTNYASAAL